MSALRAGVPITHRDQLPSTSRYELLVKIASGGMATVYVGRLSGAAGITRLVAIKRAHAHLLEDPAFGKMLIAEAKLASRIHHPNVVAVQNVEEAEGELLLVMDYVEGASLADLTGSEDIPLPARVAVRVLLDGCAGLQAAHSLEGDDGQPLGIVHRDVSPHNILVGVDGVARLTDFGIAKSSGHTASAAHTSTGALKGKVAYMAPEYVEAGQLDARSDVFSLGIVAWEALTRRRLFRGANEIESLKLVLATDVARPSEVAPWVGKGLDDVIMKALARSPRDRFSTASDFGDALEAAARREDLIATAAQVGTLVRSSTADVLARRRMLIRERHDLSETTTANARYDESTRAAIEGALASQAQTGNVGRSENTASLAGGSELGFAEISTEISTELEQPDSLTEASAPPTKTLPLGMVYPGAPSSQPDLSAAPASADGSTLGGGVSAHLVEDARADVRVGRGRRRIATYVVIAACAVGVGLFAVPALRNTGGTPRVDDTASRPEPPAPTAPAAAPGATTATATASPLPPATVAASASKPAPSAPASSSVAVHVAAPAGPPPRLPRGHVAPPPRPPAGPAPLATPPKTQTEPATTTTGDRAPPNPYAH